MPWPSPPADADPLWSVKPVRLGSCRSASGRAPAGLHGGCHGLFKPGNKIWALGSWTLPRLEQVAEGDLLPRLGEVSNKQSEEHISVHLAEYPRDHTWASGGVWIASCRRGGSDHDGGPRAGSLELGEHDCRKPLGARARPLRSHTFAANPAGTTSLSLNSPLTKS